MTNQRFFDCQLIRWDIRKKIYHDTRNASRDIIGGAVKVRDFCGFSSQVSDRGKTRRSTSRAKEEIHICACIYFFPRQKLGTAVRLAWGRRNLKTAKKKSRSDVRSEDVSLWERVPNRVADGREIAGIPGLGRRRNTKAVLALARPITHGNSRPIVWETPRGALTDTRLESRQR